MNKKRNFEVYYLILCEGSTEYNLFAYLTTQKYRVHFEKSTVKFSDKVDILNSGISKGKLNGVSNVKQFKSKFNAIKKDRRYRGQKLFFLIDRDIDNVEEIETLVKDNGDLIQFIVYNSEYLILNFSGKSLKSPTDFPSIADFREYCKEEFSKHYEKEVDKFNDNDFDSVFECVPDNQVYECFEVLFDTTSQINEPD